MQDTPHTPHPYADDEIDLLDLLVTVADNIKLLIIGPIVAGLVALGVGFYASPAYESTSLIDATSQTIQAGANQKSVFNVNVVATLATSAVVLDPVAQALGLRQQGLSVDQSRSHLQGQVKASVGRADQLLSITTTGNSPAAAQQLNQLVLEQIF